MQRIIIDENDITRMMERNNPESFDMYTFAQMLKQSGAESVEVVTQGPSPGTFPKAGDPPKVYVAIVYGDGYKPEQQPAPVGQMPDWMYA